MVVLRKVACPSELSTPLIRDKKYSLGLNGWPRARIEQDGEELAQSLSQELDQLDEVLQRLDCFCVGGAPGRNRTCDPRLRRPVLYPTELRAHDRKIA